MTIPMALVDYIPVVLFLIAAIVLQRKLYDEMSKGAFALFSAGTITVFVAGLMKAMWKLLYAANICDFEALNAAFFPMQTTGFVLAGLGCLALLVWPQKKPSAFVAAAAPTPFKGTMIFVALMVAGVAAMDLSLAKLARSRGRGVAATIFLVSFVFTLGMGYLSSRDFSSAAMNWVAEGVNICGQACFLVAAIMLPAANSSSAQSAPAQSE